jgi:tetratricopeptide (TPR) repeat protein
MTEHEYIERIKQDWPATEPPAASLLRLSARAVREFPQSAKLHCIRGDLLQLSALNSDTIRRKAMAHYRKALDLDPSDTEAMEELGYCLDVMEDLDEAEKVFRQAVEIGASPRGYYGLARVLAQKGDRAGALEVLSPSKCPFHEHRAVVRGRQEILEDLWEPLPPNSDRSAGSPE